MSQEKNTLKKKAPYILQALISFSSDEEARR